ncbi:MAG: hypothetical protein Q8P93_00540 [bacterium]|nr:hypothetical protein [bacterium]
MLLHRWWRYIHTILGYTLSIERGCPKCGHLPSPGEIEHGYRAIKSWTGIIGCIVCITRFKPTVLFRYKGKESVFSFYPTREEKVRAVKAMEGWTNEQPKRLLKKHPWLRGVIIQPEMTLEVFGGIEKKERSLTKEEVATIRPFLGKVQDTALAILLGVPPDAVHAIRKGLAIPRFAYSNLYRDLKK